MSDQEKRFAHTMKKIFEKYDKDNTGFMSFEEVRKFTIKIDGKEGEISEEDEAMHKKWFDKIDLNHDGKISFEEMSKFLGIGHQSHDWAFGKDGKHYAELMEHWGLELNGWEEAA